MRRIAGILLLGAGGALSVAQATAPALGAQEAPESATTVAREYLRGFEAAAWRATAQRIHPDALDRLRRTLRQMTRPESGRRLLEGLSGGRSEEEYFALDGGSLFVSVLRLLGRESPGIVNAMTDRDTEVVGSVAEGDSLRHVVYRLQWRLSGAEEEMKVMTLTPDGRGRWRVLRASELESLRPALRGLVLPGPPQGGAAEGTARPERPPRPR